MTDLSQPDLSFSTIAHRHHHYLSPLSPDKARGLLRSLSTGLGAADTVLDAGCGKAALLRDLLALAPVQGVGVDLNRAYLSEARDLWVRSAGDPQRLTLHHAALLDHPRPAAGYAAILCVGSSQAFGDFDACLRICLTWLQPGGRLLLADGYWKQAPAQAYLEALQGTADEFSSHAANAARARDHGYQVLRTATSSDDEWDEYEGLYCAAMMQYLAAHPDSAATAGFAQRMQDWHRAYLEWGRATLGFGYYLLQKP